MLFVSIQGDKPGYIEDLIKKVDQIELHSPVLPEEFVKKLKAILTRYPNGFQIFLKKTLKNYPHIGPIQIPLNSLLD